VGLAAAAAIGGAASLGGALLTSNASGQAASEQAGAANNSIATQKQFFNTAQGALSPYYTASASALPTLQKLLTPGQSADQLSQMPGFQFQSQWGTKTAQNALAAEGLGGSTGPLSKAISDYNNGLAGTYYGNTVNNLQQFVNSGMGAASALAGNATNSGQAIGNTQQAAGNAIASGTLGSANALAGGLTNGAGSISNSLLLSSLLGGGGGGSGGVYGGGGMSGLSSLFNSGFAGLGGP